MIIQYYSDSLGLSRPGVVSLNERYIYIFEQWLRSQYKEDIFLINRARRGATIDQLFEVFKEDCEYLPEQKDILIIHEGICDCAPRPVSRKTRKIISALPAFLRIRIISFLHKNRAAILKKGFVSYLTDKAEFERLLAEWLKLATRAFKRIYVVNIAPTNTGIENHSPGFSKSIVDYNALIKSVVEGLGPDSNVTLIDMFSRISKENSIDEYITKEDGHHITALTHRLIAQKLIDLETRYI